MKRFLLVSFIAVLLIFLIVFLLAEVNGWTCTYTGSSKRNTTLLGYIISESFNKSPIEKWIEKKNKLVNRNWKQTLGGSYSGFSLVRSCYRRPSIYYFTFKMQNEFINKSREEDIERLLIILKSEDEEAIRKALDYIIFENSP